MINWLLPSCGVCHHMNRQANIHVLTFHGNIKLIPLIPLSYILFFEFQNTAYLMNITFILDRCHCSSAAVTPVHYKCDSPDLTWTKAKMSLMQKWTKQSFRNSHSSLILSEPRCNGIVCKCAQGWLNCIFSSKYWFYIHCYLWREEQDIFLCNDWCLKYKWSGHNSCVKLIKQEGNINCCPCIFIAIWS